jgi:hypothetical protein
MKRLITSAMFAALAGFAACNGGTEKDSGGDAPEQTELPPMSVGTIQALGPHVFASEAEVEAPEGSTARARSDRLELVWQDTKHYRLSTWEAGALYRDQYREGDLVVERGSRTPFRWVKPSVSPDELTETIDPFEVNLSRFRSALDVVEVDSAPDAPAGSRRFELGLIERTHSEAEEIDRGHSALPLTLTGAVVVDEHANRLSATFEGSYRCRNGSEFDPVATSVSYSESRTPHPDGVALQPPPEASPMLMERKAEDAARVDTPENGPLR